MSNLLPDDRSSREEQTREAEMRDAPWAPPSVLPDPEPRPGIVHRWIRTHAAGQSDPINVANSFREGWTPVHGADYPELQVQSDPGTRWPDGVEVGGLLLCAAPASKMKQRSEYYARMTKRQEKSVNDQLTAEEDPRLRTMFREAYSTVSRGFGPGGGRGARHGGPPPEF